MFEKKAKKEDLDKLQKLGDLLNHHILVCQAIELKKRVLTREVLEKNKLDLNKNYSIDLKTGKITEVKS